MGRPKRYNDYLRDRLLWRAGEIVSSGGLNALSLRALAAQEGTSTSAVYSLFGSRRGLLASLYEEAFDSFAANQPLSETSTDPIEGIIRLGRFYWEWALERPHLYRIMFGGSLAWFQPTPEQTTAARGTIQPLSELVARAMTTGQLRGDPLLVTHTLWASAHGVASLAIDMGDRYRDPEYLSTLLNAVLTTFGPPARSIRPRVVNDS